MPIEIETSQTENINKKASKLAATKKKLIAKTRRGNNSISLEND